MRFYSAILTSCTHHDIDNNTEHWDSKNFNIVKPGVKFVDMILQESFDFGQNLLGKWKVNRPGIIYSDKILHTAQ